MDANDIGQGRLYEDLAYMMPLISPPEDYIEEASHWRTILREKLGPGRFAVLELGVGGGHNLSHLTADYDATAVDISESMLALCKELNPGVTLVQGDMRNVRLGRNFSAVLIHDAISYMLTEADLAAAFQTAAVHLEKGGVFITSPDHFFESFTSPSVTHDTHVHGDMQVTYFEYSYDPDPNDTTIETIMIYLIQSKDGVRIEEDRHITGLFPKETWLRLMEEAGFDTEMRTFYLDEEKIQYHLLVGTLR